jgi:hypothetical protein
VAATGLLAAPAAMATGATCTTFNPVVTVLLGPCPVSGANPTACEPAGSVTGFTGIKYSVTGSPEYVAALITANNTWVSGGTPYLACQGDPVTDLGEKSCHEKAVTFGCNQATAQFWIVVAGQKSAVLQSVAVKKGYCVKSFAVPGLGSDLNPFQQAQKFETVNFKGCAVTFQYDVVTGAVTSAALDPSQSTKPVCAPNVNDGNCCAFNGGEPVSNLSLTLNGHPLGAGVFGDGYVSSGTNSCTTRVIGGRVYTWGSPCPE